MLILELENGGLSREKQAIFCKLFGREFKNALDNPVEVVRVSR
jgi:hypothetical protein